MTVFNEGPLFDIRFEKEDSGALKLHFADDTVGFNPTTEHPGFALTPDWNDHHFTLAVPEDSVLYHVTEEGVGNDTGNRSGEGNLQPEAFIADVYGAVRGLGPVVPADRLPVDNVGKLDFDQTKEYLITNGVLQETEAGFTIDRSRKERLVSSFTTDARRKYELYDQILDCATIEEAVTSERVVYIVPDINAVWLLFFFSDEYVSVVQLRQFYATLELLAGLRESEAGGAGSQILHYLSRALTRDTED